MLCPFDLGDYDINARKKSFRIVVVQNIHIDSLITTGEERIFILVVIDAATYRCENKRSGVDSFQVASWHL